MLPTTYTLRQLAIRVLKDLGLTASDETPTAVDLAWAMETCRSEVALLEADRIPIWNGNVTSVPLEYLTLLSRRIGLAIGPSRGLFSLTDAITAMPLAEAKLRALATPAPSGVVMQSEYY